MTEQKRNTVGCLGMAVIIGGICCLVWYLNHRSQIADAAAKAADEAAVTASENVLLDPYVAQGAQRVKWEYYRHLGDAREALVGKKIAFGNPTIYDCDLPHGDAKGFVTFGMLHKYRLECTADQLQTVRSASNDSDFAVCASVTNVERVKGSKDFLDKEEILATGVLLDVRVSKRAGK